MQRDDLEQLMVSALYNEIMPAEKDRLQHWLESHPEDRREYEELSRVLQSLNRVPEPVIAESSNHLALSPEQTPKFGWLKYTAWGAAACLLALLCASQGIMIQIGTFRVAFGPAAGDEAVQRLVTQEWQERVQPSLIEFALQVEEANHRWDLLADKQTAFEQTLQNLTLLRSQDLEWQQRSFRQLASRLDQSLDERLGEYMLISQLPPDAYLTPNSGDGVNTKPE